MRASWGDRGGQEVSDSCGPAKAVSRDWQQRQLEPLTVGHVDDAGGLSGLESCASAQPPPGLSQARQRRAPAARPWLPCDPSAPGGHTEATGYAAADEVLAFQAWPATRANRRGNAQMQRLNETGAESANQWCSNYSMV
jgi:hypothetical protein